MKYGSVPNYLRTFMEYKDGSNFFITRDCDKRHRLLCDSGDIDRVVAGSDLFFSADGTCHVSQPLPYVALTPKVCGGASPRRYTGP